MTNLDHEFILKDKARKIASDFLKSFAPPEILSLSEWADRHAQLSAESSAEAGQWTTLPYQKGIMDAMTDPDIEQVTVMKSARVGYTKVVNHLIGYHISQDPCSIMVVQPTIEDAEGYSKEEIAPMIRDTPLLDGLVSEQKSKDGSNTILSKNFPGGVLAIIGANSGRGFRRVSRRVVIFDEVDAYPETAGADGDQIKLGIKRTEYFWNRKIVAGSTPLVKDFSRIEKLFLQSDQRRRFVPCPHCGAFQYLKWGGPECNYGIKWPKDEPENAYYLCEANQCIIEHKYKRQMDELGEWRPTATVKARHAGFHIWAAYSYSPNSTWGHLATEFILCKDDPMSLKTFVNTALGESWEDSISEKVGADGLKAKVELYPENVIPEGALLAGASVDVQDNRLAISIYGWGKGEEAWLVSHQEIFGDPAQAEIWAQLDNVIFQSYRHALGGIMRLAYCTIDTGGHFTNEAYQWARDRKRKTKLTHIIPIKGSSRRGKPPIGKATKQDIDYRGQIMKSAIDLFPVGTDTIKTSLFSRLKMDKAGPGYIHFHSGCTVDFFNQLTSEKQIVTYTGGRPVRIWVPKKKGIRNEALDCLVYNYAGLNYLYARHNRKTIWEQFEKRLLEGLKEISEETKKANEAPLENKENNPEAMSPDEIEDKLQSLKKAPKVLPNRRRRGFISNW